MSRKLTTEEFIKRTIKKHGYLYDYSLVDYINSKTKIKIICHIHGTFTQTPNDHLNDSKSKACGCPKCAGKNKTTEEFIQESMIIHGDKYNYYLVDYVNSTTKVKIVCSIHGIFKQIPTIHLDGHGCSKCKGVFEQHYSKNNIPTHDIYQQQLQPYGIECRRSPDDKNILEVKCVYCGKWHQPNLISVKNKISSIKGTQSGELNLYCSDNCKKDCPTYGKHLYPKGFKQGTSREVQPQLRKLVLARDGYKCVRCGKGIDEVQLHCHHLTGVELNPIESADVDNCITLCKEHHKDAHKENGCRYHDLRKSMCSG